MDSLRERYVAAQLAGDRPEALRLLVDEGLLRGVPLQTLHLEVIQLAQYEIGRLWQEHLATSISQLALSHLYRHLPRDPPNGKLVMVSCVEGELHEVGARVASDFLEMAGFHVRYLVQALDEQRASLMEGYARWLRTLLVSRGMCTRHLGQHFAGLAAALEAEGWGPGTAPHDYVRAAREALRYPDGPARALEEDAPALARAAASRLTLHVPTGERPRLEEELRLQLSYLADALAAARPELLADHVRWYAGFWPRRGLGLLAFPSVLGMLKSVLDPRHPEARSLLAAAGVSWEETRT